MDEKSAELKANAQAALPSTDVQIPPRRELTVVTEKAGIDRVVIEHCQDLIDVFRVIKAQFAPDLDKEHVRRMSLHLKPDFSDPPLLGNLLVEDLLRRHDLLPPNQVYLRISVGVIL